MRHRSALLLVTFCCGFARARAESASVTVVLSADRAVPSAVVSSLEREAEAALAEAQTSVQWQMQADKPPVAERVAMIRLAGECRFGALLPLAPPEKTGNEPLGRTHLVDGEVLPIADVQCDAIRKLVDHDLRGASAADRDSLLGRAVGRVLAHELYHILLRTPAHGARGLSRPAQTSAELLADRDAFAPEEAKRIAVSTGTSADDGFVAGGR